MCKTKFAIFFVHLCAVMCDGVRPKVETPFGWLEGYYMHTRGGRRISAFTAIPYAEPPVGDLRFRAPVPIKPWTDTLNASRTTPWCVGRNPYTRQKEIEGQEDCLFLNVYTPLTGSDFTSNNKQLLPVMFFIHGGGFMCLGASTLEFGPQYILDRDVILVTTNYRLGPLGFLSTQDEHCPGNNGLKDQQEALRFVQKTIEYFGGDSKSVTIFGESAGGASVQYHIISKTSYGLFHKAISESGSANDPWAEGQPGEALKAARKLATLLDCPQEPSEDLLTCLRTRESYAIINTEHHFYKWDYEPMTPFKVVVEHKHAGAFLTRPVRTTPYASMVPWLAGLNRDEGCLKSGWISKKLLDQFVTSFEAIAPITFYYEDSPHAKNITEEIRNMYLNGDNVKTAILDMYTDSYFAYPMVEAAELMLSFSKKPIYLYELNYEGVNSLSEFFGFSDSVKYVCHADDLIYLFPLHFLTKLPSPADIQMSELLVTLFTNFATSGDPNRPQKIPFKWTPTITAKNLEYADLGPNVMKRGLGNRSRFWDKLPLWHKLSPKSRFIDEL